MDVVAELPVGRRLQDHPFFHAVYALRPEHRHLTSAFAAHLRLASPEAQTDGVELRPIGVASHGRSRTRGVCPGPSVCTVTVPDLSRTCRPPSRTAAPWPTATGRRDGP
ncbi:hypothetical protein OG328_48815 [Streptomyces sp. NBC_01518]